MTSFEMDIMVKARIAERQHEAEHWRLARSARQARRDTRTRPPRGPLFLAIGRLATHLVQAG